ncbi:MAG: hypothetical protein C0606_07745 [Hyphomicrobiales bacterium]|nr:MAG: hypothetical protein C0606_07745 [Hyphomicrobiales bacterium]
MMAPDSNPFVGLDMASEADRMAATNPAAWMYERLALSIRDFEARLDAEHEIGARLAASAPGETVHIEDMGYWGPDLIIIHGHTEDGQPFRMMQHISQVNVVLVAVKKLKEKPNRIGFVLLEKVKEGKATS